MSTAVLTVICIQNVGAVRFLSQARCERFWS